MARLPQPGGDAGNWGDILNDYLSQAHKPDGTIKDDAISAAAIQNGAISETLLDSGVTTKLNNPTVADGAITNAKVATNAAIDADKLTDGTTNKLMSATEKTKLAGLTGKIADASDFSATNPSVGQALAVSSISGGIMTGVGVVNVLSGTATKTDNSVGLINWMNDSASGYLLHLVNGPSTTASNAALAIGTDRGAGAGLLISHKNSGIGISMGVQPGAGMGMQIAGRSTSFPLRVQLHAGSGAVSLRATTGANFSDGASTSGSTTFTSATANFTAADIGMALTQLTSRGASDPMGSIPSGATIASVESTTSITMSAAATATGTGVLFMVDGRAVSNTQNMLVVQDEQSATLTAINKTGINVKGADIASAPLKVSRKAGQTSPIFEVRDESSNPLTYIGKNGHITTTVTTALTASDISNNTIGMYYDPTPGSQKLVLVGKDSSGAFNTGQVALGAGSGSGPTGPVSSLTTGKYYGPSSVSISAAAPTQSRLRTHMVYFDASITVDRIGSDVTTAAAASTLRWVIYQDSNGYPGALVLDTGAVGDSTTTGWKEATISQTLAAGKYWFGCIAQGGNPTLRASSGSIAMPGVGLSSTEIVSLTGAAVGYFIDNVTGTPPSTFTAGASATATSPLVWVRKA